LRANLLLLITFICRSGVTAADEQHRRPFEARKYLLNEVNRHAAREKLLVSVDNDTPPAKFREAHGLTTEQVIWLVMRFEDSSEKKGGVNLTFSAPNFYLQGAVFDPGISFAKSKPFLDRMLDGFFDYGEGKR
jgi:hypothetical protein